MVIYSSRLCTRCSFAQDAVHDAQDRSRIQCRRRFAHPDCSRWRSTHQDSAQDAVLLKTLFKTPKIVQDSNVDAGLLIQTLLKVVQDSSSLGYSFGKKTKKFVMNSFLLDIFFDPLLLFANKVSVSVSDTVKAA